MAREPIGTFKLNLQSMLCEKPSWCVAVPLIVFWFASLNALLTDLAMVWPCSVLMVKERAQLVPASHTSPGIISIGSP